METFIECTENNVSFDRAGPREVCSPSYRTKTSFSELYNFASGSKKYTEFQSSTENESESVDPQLMSLEANKKQIIKSQSSKLFFVLELFTFTVCTACFIYSTAVGRCYNEYVCFRNCMFGSFVFGFFFFILVVVHNDLFQTLVEEILNQEICGKLKLQVIILASFLIIGFTDFFIAVHLCCM